VTRSGERVNFSLSSRDKKRGNSARLLAHPSGEAYGLGHPSNAVRSSAHALLCRTLSPTKTKGASQMGLTVFNQFPQLTVLLARIVRVANLVEVEWMTFVQELKRRGDELHGL